MPVMQSENDVYPAPPDQADPLAEETVKRGTTLGDQVYAIVSRGLLMGAWEPDARLSVRALAQELAVSVTPVREALTRLANEGALTSADGPGFRTVRLNRDRYQEIVHIRMALEPTAAGLAAARITDDAVALLRQQNESLGRAIAQDKFAAALQIDTAFHLAIYEMSAQPLLVSMINSLLLRAGPTRTRLSGSYRKTLVGFDHHRRILDALQARDADAVAEEVASDLRDGSRAILAELDQ
ncbi:MAG: GntR family transcriptional regulator [Pseudooceanicola sp.]|nr:GntR family transcriptional regulator [Pseudooceanicola sp.]